MLESSYRSHQPRPVNRSQESFTFDMTVPLKSHIFCMRFLFQTLVVDMRPARWWCKDHARRLCGCMASSISESSHGSSGTTSSVTPSPADGFFFRQLWRRWRPGWYFSVLAVNATAAVLLFPHPYDDPYVESQVGAVELARNGFSVLMLASLDLVAWQHV